MAGVTAVTLTYPLDTIRARLAFQVSGEHVYRGIAHTATSIVKKVMTDFYFYCFFLPSLLTKLEDSSLIRYGNCIENFFIDSNSSWK